GNCILIEKRALLTALMFNAVGVSALRLPASDCIVSDAPLGKACRPGCCTNKVCCADSQKNKSLPSQRLLNTARLPNELRLPLRIQRSQFLRSRPWKHSPDSSAIRIGISAPRLTVLCTFLI